MKSDSALSVDVGALLCLDGVGAVYTASGEFCFQPVESGSVARSFVRRATLANSYWCLQHLVSWLATGNDTNGRLALMEISGRQGFEPPPHVHTREDELYCVLDGHVTFFRGDEVWEASTGDAIFLPRGIRHWHKVKTPAWKALAAYAPAGYENYMLAFSRPARFLDLPAPGDDPVDFSVVVPRLIELGARHGIWYPPVV
jgi:quercetin dioxygenase-like cupin family protein